MMMGPLISAFVNTFPLEVLFDLAGLSCSRSARLVSWALCLADSPLVKVVWAVLGLFFEANELFLEEDLENDLKKLPSEPEFDGAGGGWRFLFFLLWAIIVFDLSNISSWLIVIASLRRSSLYTGLMSLKDIPSGLMTLFKTSSMLSTPSFSLSSLNSSWRLYWLPVLTKLLVLPMETFVNRSPLYLAEVWPGPALALVLCLLVLRLLISLRAGRWLAGRPLTLLLLLALLVLLLMLRLLTSCCCSASDWRVLFLRGGLMGGSLLTLFLMLRLVSSCLGSPLDGWVSIFFWPPALFFLIVSSRDWYRLAAIMMASSEDWQIKPWHSSCFGIPARRITQAKMGGWGASMARLISS